MLHLEILKARLERAYGIHLVVTVPSVAYHVYKMNQTEPIVIKSALALPDPSHIDRIEEPWVCDPARIPQP